MKKIIVLFLAMCVSLSVSAQKDVTKFLGIPVDGSKSEFISKLKDKGFIQDKDDDFLTGEFNDSHVMILLDTRKNKVSRVIVSFPPSTDETTIRVKFNRLCMQFKNNKKYISTTEEIPFISEDEDISYNMLVEHKNYQAAFYQLSESNFDEYGKLKQIDDNKVVWFTIMKRYGKYIVSIYYENGYNLSNGDDL